MSLENNGEEIVKGNLDVEEILTDFFLEETKKDKGKIEDFGNETLNVEGILADFFLNKMEKQNINSDSDSGKRSKKHKKHKSKKSKNKHRKSRSCSSETKMNYVKNIGDHSSSEERELQRLQKLKKMDIKENKLDSVILNNQQSINDNVSGKNNTESIVNPLTQTDEPSVSGQTFTPELNHEITKNIFQINVSVNTADVIDKGDTPSKFHQNKNMTDLKNLNSPGAVSTLSKEEGTSKEGICSNEGDSTEKEVNNFESKNIAQCSFSRSSSSSDNERKVQPNRAETEHSSSRSKLKHKHYSRERSRSRSRKRRRSRHRSRESQGSHEKYSRRKRKRSTSKKNRKSHSTSSSSDRSVSRSRYRRSRSRSNSSDYYRYEHSRRNSKSRHEKESKLLHSSSKAQDKDKASSKSRIDQAKILQLAQKNVLNMIEKGTLPQGLSIENFKREQIVSLKSGGKSVQELTDFCKKLSKKENDSEEERDTNENDRNKDLAFIHHPFKVKESSTIKLNIKNAVQIPIKTHAEKVAETARLSSQFPVSSGNQHKQKELEWVPVEPPTKNMKLSEKNNTIVAASQTISSLPMLTTKETKAPEVVSSVQQSSDVSSPISFPQSDTSVVSVPPPLPPASLDLPPPPPPPPQMINTVPQTSNQLVQLNSTDNYFASHYNYSATVTNNMFPHSTSLTQSSSVSYSFPTTSSFRSQKPVDVASIVTQRFKALTKLQSNPNDIEALNALQEAQANIQNWVESQQVPGLFTGSTGAKPLSVEELSGPKHWNYRAKKDIFTRAAPVTEGKGMSLLKKMGWNPGEGLGKNKEGSLEPLVLDIKTDKRGLVSEGEGSKKTVSSVLKELQGKHPVSALMELCSKRKWKPPLYTLIEESGPPHKRTYLFKVEVNNVEYQSANPVNNKKVAKADAAVICLQALSIFPKS